METKFLPFDGNGNQVWYVSKPNVFQLANQMSSARGPLVVSCGNQQSQWLLVVGPGGHVGKSRERLVHMSMGRR